MQVFEELGHWLALLVIIGGLYIVFARDTERTASLFKVGTNSYGDIIKATGNLGAIA